MDRRSFLMSVFALAVGRRSRPQGVVANLAIRISANAKEFEAAISRAQLDAIDRGGVSWAKFRKLSREYGSSQKA